MKIEPSGPFEEYGFYVRSDEKADKGYRINFSVNNKMVSVGNTNIKAWMGWKKPLKLT